MSETVKNLIANISEETKNKFIENMVVDIESLSENIKPISAEEAANSILLDSEFETEITDKLVKQPRYISEKDSLEYTKARRKLSMERSKKEFVALFLLQQEKNFMDAHGFRMNSQQRRNLKRKIERDYDKGKYDFALNQNLNE